MRGNDMEFIELVKIAEDTLNQRRLSKLASAGTVEKLRGGIL